MTKAINVHWINTAPLDNDIQLGIIVQGGKPIALMIRDEDLNEAKVAVNARDLKLIGAFLGRVGDDFAIEE